MSTPIVRLLWDFTELLIINIFSLSSPHFSFLLLIGSVILILVSVFCFAVFLSRIMNGFEVEMINGGLKAYFVYFHGPKDCKFPFRYLCFFLWLISIKPFVNALLTECSFFSGYSYVTVC